MSDNDQWRKTIDVRCPMEISQQLPLHQIEARRLLVEPVVLKSVLLQAQDAAGDAAGSAKSATGDVTGSAKSAGGDIASNAKSAAGDAKGAAQSAGRQIDQATPDLSGVFDDVVGKVLPEVPNLQ